VRKDMGSKKTCKERGEWAELCFMARAADRGLNVSRPHGDSASYDVGVEQNGRFLRIRGEVYDVLPQGIVHIEYYGAEA
jgi:PD-(D/E)XK endonuclease